MGVTNPETIALLRLTLTPGLGPRLLARLRELAGSWQGVLGLSAAQLQKVTGIGAAKGGAIARAMSEAGSSVSREIEEVERLGARLIKVGDAEYPALLAEIPDAPPLLYVKGLLDPAEADRFPVAIVGSRRCSQYGQEQAGRFAQTLAGSGLTIISGGARGIDTAAHHGALRGGGRTIAVLGCGLAHAYPPENASLFATLGMIDGDRSAGAVISELPIQTPPQAENFPARNRIISGMALGVLVIEAASRSGALITARQAVEDHNREVFAVPGRVDSPASAGCNELLKSGGAALVTEPADVIAALESPARHAFLGTHRARYAVSDAPENEDLFTMNSPSAHRGPEPEVGAPSSPGTPIQRAILAALTEPRTFDELVVVVNLPSAALRAELTLLEIARRVTRVGSRYLITSAKR